MHMGFRYRLYPNASQRVLLEKHFGCTRFAYNYGLSLKIKAWETEKKSLSQFDLCKVFPKLRKEKDTEWLSEVCSHSLQCEMANLDVAFTKFFKYKKKFPKFKCKHKDKKSYTTNSGLKVGESYIKLPKIGNVRAVISRPIIGRIVKATVTKSSTERYFVSVTCEDEKEIPSKLSVLEERTVGIDLGLAHFCTVSTGEKIENPRYRKKMLAKLRRAQRKFARRVKGSANRIKQRKLVAKIHEKIANRRSDFHHKLSTRLVGDNQTNAIALETLSVSGMQKNRKLAQSIGDAGWSKFVEMLEYKSERSGKTILRIGRFEPSSRLCSCGILNKDLKMSENKWTCESCGMEHDRDILAANNIKRMALHPKQSIPAEGRESTPVEILE